ncbi:MAG: 3,4-dihydroxy-2-butanone-4-phosphate synthase, partial [Nannocystaceae bacterium]
MDDEDRENEGDLVIAADFCDADAVNFMSKEGRGLICLSLTAERVEALGLPMMVPRDPGHMGTAFTVSIEARTGVTTGISAHDRARTIEVARDEECGAQDIVTPGHVFPLRAQPGGVLVRSGHTEGSVDIARLAGLRPAAVICEIMRDDGQMARRDDLDSFARTHDLKILTIADLIEYRLGKELLVREVSSTPFHSTHLGIAEGTGWTLRVFEATVEPTARYVVLQKGDVGLGEEPVLMRAQRAHVLGDVFGDPVDDSASRMTAAIRQIESSGRGLFMYVLGAEFSGATALRATPAEGPVGLKPRESGFREFGLGAQVLRFLGVSSINVMTNNPRKIIGLAGFGI